MSFINEFKDNVRQHKIIEAWDVMKEIFIEDFIDLHEKEEEIERCFTYFQDYYFAKLMRNPKFNITEDELKLLPNIKIGNQLGDTNYIDFLSQEDSEYSIMKGIDIMGRPFFLINLILFMVKPEEIRTRNIAITFFQRYDLSSKLWMISSEFPVFSCGGMNDSQFEMLNNLLKRKRIEVTEDHGFFLMKNSKSRYFLFDYEKWASAAVNTIIKNWRIYKSRI